VLKRADETQTVAGGPDNREKREKNERFWSLGSCRVLANPPQMDIAGSSSRDERLESLFGGAADLDVESRSTYLARVCLDDPEMRSEVESLLAAYDAHAQNVRGLFDELPLANPRDLDAGTDGPQTLGLSGSEIGQYRILEKVGGGGMGVVYQAYDARLDRIVALKFLPPHLLADQAAKARFAQEAKAASALDHPNICTIHDIGETQDGRLFIAMRYYAGETLKKKIARGEIQLAEAVDYTIQAARGLEKAHAAGIVHRDIKPANLLVTEENVVKILDFGIAKMGGSNLTETGATMGTVAYMSPEQIRGEEVDQQTDVWALGAVLYEMITGDPPFSGGSNPALIYSVLKSEPDLRAIVDPGVRVVVTTCLRKDRRERFGSVQELGDALELVAEGVEPEVLTLPRRRRRVPALAVGLTAAGAVVVGLIAWFLMSPVKFVVSSPVERPMLVVLPFENLGDAKDQYFSDGLAEELSTRLSSTGSFGVISRTTANRYRGTSKTAMEIGKELGVDYVIGGSVRWDSLATGSRRVRIAPYLDRVADDRQIWAEVYERRDTEVLEVQRSLALSIVKKLTMTLDSADVQQLEAGLTGSPQAYQEYFKGLAVLKEPLVNPDHTVTGQLDAMEARTLRAVQHFQNALDLDSSFVQAATKIVEVAGFVVFNENWHLGRTPSQELKDVALQAANWTSRVDPDSRADLLANAYYNKLVVRNYDAALDLFTRALKHSEDAEVLGAAAETFRDLGNWDSAAVYDERAIVLDPENIGLLEARVKDAHYLRQFPTALRYRERIALVDSTLGHYCGWTGVFANLIRIDRNTKRVRAMIGGSVPECHMPDFWDRRFERLVQRHESGEYVWPPYVAESYRQLGRSDQEREAYERAKGGAVENNLVTVLGWQAWADAGLGNRDAALSELAEFKSWIAENKGQRLTRYNWFAGWVYLRLGMYDELFEVLEDDVKGAGWYNSAWLRSPFFDPVRDDPRFELVLAKFDQWEASWR